MPKAFDFSSPPFDRLRPMEVDRVNHVVDVVFFRTGQTVLTAGTLPDHFYIVIKGLVEERAGAEVVAVHESGDGFDSEILVHQAARHDFVVREEAICYALPIEDFLELTANNPAFAAFFFMDISHKLDALGQRQASPQAPGALTMRVHQATLNQPVFVAPETTPARGGACTWTGRASGRCWCATATRIGIFTGVDLTRAAVAQRQPLETPVRDLVHWGVHGTDADSFLFEAALLMARKRVRHLVVRREGEIVGVLDAANVLSSLANQADPIGALIDRAADAGGAGRGQRADQLPDPPAARDRHQDRLRHRALDRPAPPHHRQAVPITLAPGGPGRACLPRRHGQRGPGRVPVQDRSGQRHHPGRRLPAAGLGRLSPALHRRHDRGGLPRLPGRDHGPQPRLVEAATGLVRRRARLGAEARRAGADERRDLLRRGRRRRRRPAARPGQAAPVRPAGRRHAPSTPASPARSSCSTRRSASSRPSSPRVARTRTSST